MNVVALRAPKQLAETMRARESAPMGPKTTEPKCTAMVVEEEMEAGGSTKM